MSQIYGNIGINDGCILYLDAGNIKSYPGEPTTNLLTNSNFSTSDISGWGLDPKNNGGATVVPIPENPSSNCVKLTGATTGSAYILQSVNVSSGSIYSLSFDAKNVNSDSNSGYIIFRTTSDVVYTFNFPDSWKRMNYQYTATSTTTLTLCMRISQQTFESQSAMYSNIQFEQKSHSTPYTPSVRSGSNGWKDISGYNRHMSFFNYNPPTGTDIEFNGHNSYAGYQNYDVVTWNPSKIMTIFLIAKNLESSPDGYIVSCPFNGNGEYNYQIGSTGINVAVGSQYTSYYNTFFPYNVTCSCALAIDSSYVMYYQNGICLYYKHHGITNLTPTYGTYVSTLTLGTLYPYGNGTWDQPTFSINCNIYVFKMFNRFLSSTEILFLHNSYKGRYL